MTSLRAIPGCLALAVIVTACGGDPSGTASAEPTVANVGELPVQSAAPLLGFGAGGSSTATGSDLDASAASSSSSSTASSVPASSSPDSSTEPPPTTPRTTVPRRTTTTLGVPSSIARELSETTDPDRRAWLYSAARAGEDTYAGGADTAELVDGNRVLVIGDSILASTSRRYGGETCEALEPQGWAVEVDAETGRFIDFGKRVLDRRLDAGWDAAVVMLGNNYGADQVVFEEGLREIVDELAPRPTVLLSVTMYRDDRAEVNEAVYDVARDYDNVRVVDWAGETADDPALLGGDGLHLSDAGRSRIAEMIADELGDAPFGDEGDCLGSDFTDDSATAPGSATLPGQAPSPNGGGSGSGSGSGNGSGSGSGSGNGGGSGGGGTATTAAPVTQPPATDPPVTDPPAPEPTTPPVTNPPVTQPPVTQPPATQPPATTPPVTEAPGG